MEYAYRVYGWRYEGGIDEVTKNIYVDNLDMALSIGRNLNPKEYIQYLIVQHDIKKDSDFPIIRETLYTNKEYRRGKR